MARKTYARRYAQAVFEIALQAGELDRWQADLAKIVAAVGDKEVAALLEHPRLPYEDKNRLLAEGLPEVNPLALNLVRLLMSQDSLHTIGSIVADYQRRLNRHRGIETAEVITAVPLNEKDRASLTRHLGAITGKKVVIESSTAPELIGGVVVRVGGKLLDGSTRSKLAALKRAMVGAKI